MIADIGLLSAENVSQVLYCASSWYLVLDGISVQRC